MKSPIECKDKLNELIAFAGAQTAEDHACLGALLLSAGSAFAHQSNLMSLDDLMNIIRQGAESVSGNPNGIIESITQIGRE